MEGKRLLRNGLLKIIDLNENFENILAKDIDPDVYPGRSPLGGDRYFDSDCNEIKGINHENDETWEDLYCRNEDRRGVAILGYSAGAHFAIPEIWFRPHTVN